MGRLRSRPPHGVARLLPVLVGWRGGTLGLKEILKKKKPVQHHCSEACYIFQRDTYKARPGLEKRQEREQQWDGDW
jgi:hypothetical protein